MIKICTSTFHETEAPTKSPLPKSRCEVRSITKGSIVATGALIGRRFCWTDRSNNQRQNWRFEMSTVCCQHTLTRLCECMDGCGYCSTILRIHDVVMSLKCQVSSIINRLIYWTIHFVGSNRLGNTILTTRLWTGWLHSNRRTADRRCVSSCSPTGVQHILCCAKKRKGLHNLLHSVQELLSG